MSKLRLFFLLLTFIAANSAHAKQEILLALTSIQPPFVIEESSETGLIYDVVQALNEAQPTYFFTTKLFPAKRLLANYDESKIHMVAYNDIQWGWKTRGGKKSVNLTNGKDVFFTLKNSSHDSSHMKEIAAVRGFHYAFAKFDTDTLSAMSNVSLVSDEEAVMKLVEYARVQKGIVSQTYLDWIAKSDPDRFAKFTIDPKPDHTYQRQLIMFPASPIQPAEINSLIFSLYESGRLQKIYNKYGLKLPKQSPETKALIK